eukprot:9486826-Pyramimonas_sp.AAC.1
MNRGSSPRLPEEKRPRSYFQGGGENLLDAARRLFGCPSKLLRLLLERRGRLWAVLGASSSVLSASGELLVASG